MGEGNKDHWRQCPPALGNMVRGLIGNIIAFLNNEDKSWIWRQGLVVPMYVSYGVGSYLVENADRQWNVVWWYVVGAALAWGVLVPWVLLCKRGFRKSQRHQHWADELRCAAWSSFFGVTGVGVVTLTSQVLLMKVYCPDAPKLWLISFAIVSSALAAVACYFFIGYPGMIDLEASRAGGGGDGGASKPHPRGLKASLEAELAMLRTTVSALVSLYGFAVVGVLLGLDEISRVLDRKDGETFADVPFPTQVWFIVGVALLLGTCHWAITGPVHGRYFRIARWLREGALEED